jgi:hypothetical protein
MFVQSNLICPLSRIGVFKVVMIHYDTCGLGAHDLTAWRIGGAEISDANTKTHFSQSMVAKWEAGDGKSCSLSPLLQNTH